MIPKYDDFKAAKTGNSREVLPAGGYVGEIKKAEVLKYSWGSKLVIAYDITEGEYAGFFMKDWQNNQNDDKKWRGNLSMTLPMEDGSEQDVWKKRAIGNLAASLEESNPGYHWDWDETKLKCKKLGFLVREREWEMNGRTGWTTEACSCTDIESIRSGHFRIPKARPLAHAAAVSTAPASDYAAAASDDDLPF